ncbi:uncharacterized mitochondrial protein AtMg00810-like [Setaria viridis]|uniref:uncharacterized mitochondrial protein AtMg00810-like n=1 Tax=Setaria viridis TaxID=4556 RepID=UPI0014933356|nr:uncharacterized mitochondrial protein AtMg00810-like [Setaria viridis]
MANCKPVPTPVDTKPKVSANDDELLSDATFYHSIDGALQYLTLTQPNIAYTVNQACLHMHASRDAHWNLIKRVLRYLRGTINDGIHVSASSSSDLTVYSDADWARCPDTRRSTSGYCVFLGNTLVSWSSKRQTTKTQFITGERSTWSFIYISYAKRFSWGTCVSFRFRLGSNLEIS